jgi:hypothetical protein
MHVTKRIDLDLLGRELATAGVTVNGLSLFGTESDAELLTHTATDADGNATTTELPPGAVPVVEAHDAGRPSRTQAFETAEDSERLALVAERAQADPAFAALAELTLRKQGG